MSNVTRMPAVPAARKTKTPCTLFSKYEDGRKRYLKFDANKLADFEQETGMGFAQMLNQKAVYGAARAMVWAGLKHEDRSLTVEGAGNLISKYLMDDEVEAGVHTVNEILTVCIAAAVEQGALGKLKQVEEEEPEEESAPETKVLSDGIENADPNVIDVGPKPTN